MFVAQCHNILSGATSPDNSSRLIYGGIRIQAFMPLDNTYITSPSHNLQPYYWTCPSSALEASPHP